MHESLRAYGIDALKGSRDHQCLKEHFTKKNIIQYLQHTKLQSQWLWTHKTWVLRIWCIPSISNAGRITRKASCKNEIEIIAFKRIWSYIYPLMTLRWLMRDPKLVSICILKHGIRRTWHEPTGSSWYISRDRSSARSSKLWSQASFGRKPCALGSSATKTPEFSTSAALMLQFYPTKPIKNQCKHLKNGGLKFKEASFWDCKRKGSVTSWYVMFVGFKRSQGFAINGDIFRD